MVTDVAKDLREVGLRALVCGVSGQDGAYLARLLLDKGYEVAGTSRDAQVASLRIWCGRDPRSGTSGVNGD